MRNTKGRLLTDRELEVLRHIAKGLTNKRIAQLLDLSVKTIEAHRATMYNKLGITGTVSLLRKSLELGLVTFP